MLVFIDLRQDEMDIWRLMASRMGLETGELGFASAAFREVNAGEGGVEFALCRIFRQQARDEILRFVGAPLV